MSVDHERPAPVGYMDVDGEKMNARLPGGDKTPVGGFGS
jgi:hypothetical protein